MIYLDTHVVAWLYFDDRRNLPASVRSYIDGEDLFISPMVGLELTYMHDLSRLTAPADVVLNYLGDRIGLQVCRESFEKIVRSANRLSWTRDPFDRIIVGHAALRQRPLVTKDDVIRANYPHAFWSET